jgi:hypothetical protein
MRTAIIQALRKQGYGVKNGVILMPEDPSKDDFRALNTLATQKKLEKSGPGVKPYEDRLIQYIANGHEVVPQSISAIKNVHKREHFLPAPNDLVDSLRI